ncbi:MAG: hypothetical protein R3B96_10880, partial [Pirellulaceae bacterium]
MLVTGFTPVLLVLVFSTLGSRRVMTLLDSPTRLRRRPTRLVRAFVCQVALMLALFSFDGEAEAQPAGFNYDESKVPEYVLPDPLVFASGDPVTSADDWAKRRVELYDLFAREMFGVTPDKPVDVSVVEAERKNDALGGKATRRQLTVTLSRGDRRLVVSLLLYTPNDQTGPVPTFLGLNFNGNHTVETDPAIPLPMGWVPNNPKAAAENNRASAEGRGSFAHRWPVEAIVDEGFGVATAYYGDLDPDFDDGFA